MVSIFNLKYIYHSLISNENNSVIKRKLIFTYVRDIQYSLSFWKIDDVLKNKKGNCYWKSRLLAELLKLDGYSIRFCLARYKLANYPEEVKYIPNQIDYHHFIEVKVNWKWITVDPTYDKWLCSSNFIVNEWDWINPTELSVKPIDLKIWKKANKDFDIEYNIFNQEIDKAIVDFPIETNLYSKKFEEYLIKIRKLNIPQKQDCSN